MAYQVNNSASGSPPFTDDNIKSVLCDFFGAGNVNHIFFPRALQEHNIS